MKKQIVVLMANVKYPSSNNSHLSANSYLIETEEEREKAINDFKGNVEVDGFKILNMMAYIVPDEQITKV